MEELEGPGQEEAQIARDTLERYSGSRIDQYQPYLLLTNFSRYVDYFAETRKLEITEGAMFKAAHDKENGISILDFKIGSPAAALVVDICAHLPFRACLLLGMCAGLRRHYAVGDYFVPIASIRDEGTSDFYFPKDVPALANFLVQKGVTDVLENDDVEYHIGITHTTNKRFWEFNEEFKERLKTNRAQALELECATLFLGSYRHKLPLGALLLISDLPLARNGIKTKASSEIVFSEFMPDHVERGIRILEHIREQQAKKVKGARRGPAPQRPH